MEDNLNIAIECLQIGQSFYELKVILNCIELSLDTENIIINKIILKMREHLLEVEQKLTDITIGFIDKQI